MDEPTTVIMSAFGTIHLKLLVTVIVIVVCIVALIRLLCTTVFKQLWKWLHLTIYKKYTIDSNKFTLPCECKTNRRI